MSNLLKAEFYKLFHGRYFWEIALFNFILSSILLLDSIGKTFNLLDASLYNIPILFFLIIVFCALYIGNDFEQKTLYSYISGGHKRSQVIFAKAIVYETAGIGILYFPLFIHSVLGVFLRKETFDFDKIWNLMMPAFFATLAMCMLPYFFAVLFRDLGRSLVVPMFLYFLMIFLMNGDLAQQITRILPMGQLRLISLQETSGVDSNYLVKDIWWIIILYGGSYLCFWRSDLK